MDTLQGLDQKRFIIEDRKELFWKTRLTQWPETLPPAAGKDYCKFLN